MSHRTRIAALEKRLAPAIAMPMLIRIKGGLPDADPMRTTVAARSWSAKRTRRCGLSRRGC